MRVYLEIARRGFMRYSTYRAATVAGLFTNTIFGFMKCYIMTTVFVGAALVGGYSRSDTLTYVWLTQALLATVYIWGWTEVGERIRSGDIASDLQRPIGLQSYWLSQDLGRSAYHFIARGFIPFAIGALAFHLRLPEHAWTIPLFLVSIIFATMISFAVRFMTNLSAFWFFDHRGMMVHGMVVVNVFSGFVVPLRFFPGSIRDLLLLNPLAFIVQFPIDLFLEKYSFADAVGRTGIQILWLAALLAATRAVVARGTRRLVVQGG
jgi:ABC-2 type transport system permease protein